MSNFSIIIAHRNEDYLWYVINALIKDIDFTGHEILIIDDFSEFPVKVNQTLYPMVKVVTASRQVGVGTIFEIGIRQAKYENIILMGADVIVGDSTYLQKAEDYILNYPESIGCSTCISLSPTHLDPAKPSNDLVRYGATLLPMARKEDLRSDNDLLLEASYRVDIFEPRWIQKVPAEPVAEVPVVYGAFYITTKSFMLKTRMWDGYHRAWGNLESWLSLKVWLMGGRCHVLRDLVTGHIFGKFTERSPHGRVDYFWRSKFFVAYTMLDEEERTKLLSSLEKQRLEYECYMKAYWMGLKMIKNNMEFVNATRRLNEKEFVHDFGWYCEKFGIERTYLCQ